MNNTVPFGELFAMIRNGLSVQQDKSGDGLPVTRIETISAGLVDETRVGYAGLDEGSCRDWLLHPGDVLFSHINSVEHIGKCALYEGKPERLVHGMNLLCLRPDPAKLDPRFGVALIRTPDFRHRLSRFINKAVNQASVSITNLKTIPVVLPPIDEQRRIAAILDKANALRVKRAAGLAGLDELSLAIFIAHFGDPIRNERGWPVKPLGSQITSIRYGTGSPPPYIDWGIPFLRATDIKGGRIQTSALKYIGKADAQKIEKCRVKAGDLILVRSGVNAGDCAVVPQDLDGAYAAYDLVVELDACSATFYNFFINSPYGKATLGPLTRRAGQPHLNADQIKNLKLVAPSATAKEKFASCLGIIETIRSAQEREVRKLDALFASLQHRAFRSEL